MQVRSKNNIRYKRKSTSITKTIDYYLVDIHGNYEKYDTDKGPRGKGRPSKGGQALRAKRYYIKNHLLVLQKRKLKRYMDKVKKLAAESNYNPNAIMDKLGPKCQEYTKRHHPNIK
jgi:hypothetical protein